VTRHEASQWTVFRFSCACGDWVVEIPYELEEMKKFSDMDSLRKDVMERFEKHWKAHQREVDEAPKERYGRR
jgi:hypothetical protein